MAEVLLALRFLLAALLYAFLGLAFAILWRTLQQGEVTTPSTALPLASLILEQGNNVGERITLRPITSVGRADDNNFILEDPFASAHHALIFWREAQWWVEDLESHNGTYLNDRLLSSPQPLASGDRLRIGEAVLRFEANSHPVTRTLDQPTPESKREGP